MRTILTSSRHYRVAFGTESSWRTGELTIGDRERAVLLGTREGRTANELAIQLRVATRSVYRIRARLRQRGEL